MATIIGIRATKLTDGSKTYEMYISQGVNSVEFPLTAQNEEQAARYLFKLHDVLASSAEEIRADYGCSRE